MADEYTSTISPEVSMENAYLDKELSNVDIWYNTIPLCLRELIKTEETDFSLVSSDSFSSE